MTAAEPHPHVQCSTVLYVNAASQGQRTTGCCHRFMFVFSPLLSRERQAELSGVGGDRLQHASHHHLHETHEAAVHEQQQGT